MPQITLRFHLLAIILIACSAVAAPKNVLLICVDDLRPELKSFGADYIHSPNIDKLAATGRAFTRHYVNAPSCGPSRYTLLTGQYGPPHNGALFVRAERLEKDETSVPPSMPEWFRKHGYTTVSVGKISHHPGGRGGRNWDDGSKLEMPNAWDRHLMPSGEWQHPRGAMHGLAHGSIRKRAGEHPVFEAKEGPNEIYPDGLIANEGMRQIEDLAKSDEPFFLAVGLIRPHLPFGAPKRFLDLYEGVDLPPIPHPDKPGSPSTWHRSGEFMKYQRWGKNPNNDPQFADAVRRHYAACVSYVDDHVGMLIEKLEASGAADDTVIVLWGDHGFHLGEHTIWGKHALFEESLHSPLIIISPEVEKPGTAANGVVETLDIFPTLCDLTGVETPDFATGKSLLPMLHDPATPGHSAIAYIGSAKTVRTDRYRYIAHKNGEQELYDHASPEKETRNIAGQNPKVVQLLQKILEEELAK
ncbi:iduronate-2-sulfatase [Coraliomargarita sinensis]|uniref:Iduronate-2-sulfatase n=1 Tax=Coraliomargarita sinensis TaxID=2174842 RepID=A0A317ZHD5_9BACT|nr:sulfatase [Coraliomargarita sinensis]PXA03643.1 iduronate-2-sulfatase [Coraliomargarita sinensis]